MDGCDPSCGCREPKLGLWKNTNSWPLSHLFNPLHYISSGQLWARQSPKKRTKPQCQVHFLSLKHSSQKRLDSDGLSSFHTHILLCHFAQAYFASRKSCNWPGCINLLREKNNNIRKSVHIYKEGNVKHIHYTENNHYSQTVSHTTCSAINCNSKI